MELYIISALVISLIVCVPWLVITKNNLSKQKSIQSHSNRHHRILCGATCLWPESNGAMINYNLRSWDDGKHWYVIEFDGDFGMTIKGESESVFPGLVSCLSAFSCFTRPQVDAKDAEIPKNTKQQASWLDFLPMLVFIVLVYGAWVLYHRVEQEADKKYVEQVTAITTAIPVLIDRIRETEKSYQEMQPDVIWSGEGAKILLVNQREYVRMLGGIRTSWTVLARTPKGRFFKVGYELYKRDDCDDPLKCVGLNSFHGLTEEKARAEIFNAGNRKLYRELFGEDMPPNEVKA